MGYLIITAQENMEAKMIAFLRNPTSESKKLAMAAYDEFVDVQLDDWVEKNFMEYLHGMLSFLKVRDDQQTKVREALWATLNDVSALDYYPKNGKRNIAS